MPAPSCPKCGGRFQQGFLLDRQETGWAPVDWVEGEPAPSFWAGLKLRGRARYPVATARCERCGFLELFAQPRD
jgi:hypothetical protein